MRRRPAAALALLVAAFACSAAAPDDRERLDALHQRIERLRSTLAETEEDRSEARNELRDSEKAISEANRALRDLARERAAAEAQLRSFSATRAQLESAAAEHERQLGRVLAALYTSGDPGFMKLVLSGRDPNQTARDLRYLAYLSRAQAALAASLHADAARLREAEEQSRASAAERATIEQAQRRARDELVKQRSLRRVALQRVSARLRVQKREVESLTKDEARLAKLLEELSRPLAPASARRDSAGFSGDSGFSGLKGHLPLPLQGVIAHRFGAPRTRGGPSWKGLFIRAQPGAEVHAVAAGQVVFSDWMRGYGNILIIDHGEGYLTVYGNNESLLKTVGDRVAVKEVISTVGASGGGEETGLYFEARHEGKAFDPMSWVSLR